MTNTHTHTHQSSNTSLGYSTDLGSLWRVTSLGFTEHWDGSTEHWLQMVGQQCQHMPVCFCLRAGA